MTTPHSSSHRHDQQIHQLLSQAALKQPAVRARSISKSHCEPRAELAWVPCECTPSCRRGAEKRPGKKPGRAVALLVQRPMGRRTQDQHTPRCQTRVVTLRNHFAGPTKLRSTSLPRRDFCHRRLGPQLALLCASARFRLKTEAAWPPAPTSPQAADPDGICHETSIKDSCSAFDVFALRPNIRCALIGHLRLLAPWMLACSGLHRRAPQMLMATCSTISARTHQPCTSRRFFVFRFHAPILPSVLWTRACDVGTANLDRKINTEQKYQCGGPRSVPHAIRRL